MTREEYDSCRISQADPRVVAVCDKPHTQLQFTITFRYSTVQYSTVQYSTAQFLFIIANIIRVARVVSNIINIHHRGRNLEADPMCTVKYYGVRVTVISPFSM